MNKSVLLKKAAPSEAAKLYDEYIEPYFPDDEKKPLSSILRMMETGLYEILYLTDGKESLGVAFLTTYPGGHTYLLDYLAVDKKKRGEGYGGIILQSCREYLKGHVILVETECLDTAAGEEEKRMREKRNSFYKNNGVIQSALQTAIWGVAYDNWQYSSAPLLTEEEMIKEISAIYRFMIDNPVLYKEKIQIPRRK